MKQLRVGRVDYGAALVTAAIMAAVIVLGRFGI
jgi:hypothetical protein